MAVQESRLVISIDARNAERTARALNSELQGITNNGNKAVSQTNALGSAMQSLAGYMAGVVTVGAAINKIDAYTNLQNRLKLVTNSQQELNKAMNDTFGIAQRSYQTWDSVVQVYQRFSDNAKTLGINMEQTAKLTETVSKAVAVSGASAEAAEAALTQFGQALASGTLRGEELNSILEQTPALAKAIAQGMGITVGELRSVAAEGKITGEVLVDALTKSADSVEQLFSKTDITISQSIGLLSNELTKFIGEAGQSSGAANLLAGSIKLLAENLSLLADAAVIGGIGYITKAIITKTVAVQGAIAASIAQKAAAAAEAQTSIALATAKVNEAKAHLANVQATNAETQAKYGATVANARYKLASDAVTQALIAQTAAQGALNKSVSLGSRALALVGGPIGAITIGVSALAAGYMYLQNRTAEANAKLEEQARVAEKTDEALKELTGNDKAKAVDDLTAAFNDQNKKLAESKEAVDAVLFAIRASSVENERARKITEDARNGVISYTDAIKLLNNEKISVDLYNKLKDQVDQYDENSIKAGESQRALSALGKEVKLAGNLFQNAAVQVAKNTNELNSNANAADKAAKAQKGYFDSLRAEVLKSNEELALLNLGYSEETVKKILELQKAKQAVAAPGTTAIVTNDEIEQIVGAQKALDALKEKKDAITAARTDSIREQNKESKKGLKITQAELEVAKRSAALIESSGLGKYAESKGIPSSVIAGLLAQESKGIRDAKSHTGAIGYFQTTSRYRKQNNMSVADSYDLVKSGKIVIDNIAKVYEKTGDLAQAILSHNAGEGGARQFTKTGKVKGSAERNKEVSQYVAKVSRYSDIIAGGVGKGGLSDGDSDRAYGEQIKARLELVKQGLNLQEQYEEEQAKRTKARNGEINLAQQTGQTALIPKINERYDAEEKLAQKQFDFEVNGYKWTEEQKLDYTYETNSLRLVAEGKLTKEQRKKAVALLDERYAYEKAQIQLAKETRMFQMKEAFLSETDAINQRYALEERRIMQINDVEERRFALSAIRLQKEIALQERLSKARGAVAADQAQNMGLGAFVAIEQNRQQQEANSEALFQAELANNLGAREQLWAEHVERVKEINRKADADLLSLQFNYGQQITGSFADIFKNIAGEQSNGYKLMFTAQKAFAIAQSAIAIQQGIAQAFALPFPLNLVAAATVAAQTASIVSNIKAIRAEGFKDGGYTGNVGRNQVAGVVHGQEYVLNAEATKRVGRGTLDALNNGGTLDSGGGVNVIINVPQGYKAVQTQSENGVTIDIVENMINQSWGNVSRPNSNESRAIQGAFGIAPKR